MKSSAKNYVNKAWLLLLILFFSFLSDFQYLALVWMSYDWSNNLWYRAFYVRSGIIILGFFCNYSSTLQKICNFFLVFKHPFAPCPCSFWACYFSMSLPCKLTSTLTTTAMAVSAISAADPACTRIAPGAA